MRALALMNKALFGKWIWRFASEEGSLWRHLICLKYGEEDYGWKSKEVRGICGVGLWKDIRRNLAGFVEIGNTKLGTVLELNSGWIFGVATQPLAFISQIFLRWPPIR